MMDVVVFTDLELYGLWKLAQERDAAHPRTQNQRIDPRTQDVVMNYVGLKAELAVASVCGLPLDLRISGRGDLGVDLDGPCGTIDVKMARRGGPLYVRVQKRITADMLVLVWPYSDDRDPYAGGHQHFWARNCVVVGGITTAAFLQHATMRDWGYGPCRVLRADRLVAPQTLMLDTVPKLA